MKMYHWNANDYAKHSSAQQAWAGELIAKLNLRGFEHVLDVGCGDGKVTAEIAAHVPYGSVVGIDNSQSMIEAAEEKYPSLDYQNLSFLFADARSLPFEQEFDVVFSNASLHWIRDHRPALKGLYKSLRPGGHILIQMGGRGNAASILSILDDMIKDGDWRSYFNNFAFPYGFYAPEDYEPWLLKASLQPIRIEMFEKDMTHDGPSGLAGWVRTTWLPYTERIPEKMREGFITEIVERYLRKFPVDANGKTHVRMVRLEVEARKEV